MTIQQILSMYAQVFGLYHDQTISEAFLAFLMYLFEGIKFNYPKLIVESMCEQLSNFNMPVEVRPTGKPQVVKTKEVIGSNLD